MGQDSCHKQDSLERRQNVNNELEYKETNLYSQKIKEYQGNSRTEQVRA